MQNAAKLVGPLLSEAPSAEVYLGPAEVMEVRGGEVWIELPDGEVVPARLALAFPYEPVPGDVLLVIGKGGDHYGIGVLSGAGKAILAIHGDVDLRAVGGTLHLGGDRGVKIETPDLAIHAQKLRTVADSVIETCSSVYQRISSLWSVHAKEAHTVVDGASVTHAKSAAITTEDTVFINGKQINLG
jgi:hypothetical protein